MQADVSNLALALNHFITVRHSGEGRNPCFDVPWIPAFAGMTIRSKKALVQALSTAISSHISKAFHAGTPGIFAYAAPIKSDSN